MRRAAGSMALLLVAATCGTPDEPIATGPSPTSSSTTTTSAAAASEPTTATTPPTVDPKSSYEWPDPDGPPPWTSVPLGLPGTTHVRVTYGPLGFLSINNVSRGAVVRTSIDGSNWEETAILMGPDGQEQVSVTDLIVTDREFLVTGETWTNTATGSEIFHDVLWRSADGVAWDTLLLSQLAPGAKATSLVVTSPGLVVVGANYDSDTGEASPRVWLEQAGGDFVDLISSIPGFDDTGWIERAIATAKAYWSGALPTTTRDSCGEPPTSRRGREE